MLWLHILSSLFSLGAATVLWLKPSKKILRVTYILVVLTVCSGGLLAWGAQVPLLQTSVVGLGYLGAVLTGMVQARAKLA